LRRIGKPKPVRLKVTKKNKVKGAGQKAERVAVKPGYTPRFSRLGRRRPNKTARERMSLLP